MLKFTFLSVNFFYFILNTNKKNNKNQHHTYIDYSIFYRYVPNIFVYTESFKNFAIFINHYKKI